MTSIPDCSRVHIAQPLLIVVGAAVLIALPACGSSSDTGLGPEDNPKFLTDSTGAVFGWECTDDGCELNSREDSPAPVDYWGTGEGRFEIVWGRFFLICSASFVASHWESADGWCRPAACDVDKECPQLFKTPGTYGPDGFFVDVPSRYYEFHESFFTCASGLCQSTDTEKYPPGMLYYSEISVLCFAPMPREDTIEPIDIHPSVDPACENDPTKCVIPDGCWQI